MLLLYVQSVGVMLLIYVQSIGWLCKENKGSNLVSKAKATAYLLNLTKNNISVFPL